ncbi:MAG TPA: class I SAM-dependent methyltransferase [Vicinamibacteria bacterium]|nr:class I SAM-dependent methyltransferase [Vicinamibacteria bacterium]
MFDRQVMESFYKNAKTASDLPWHREEPDTFLVDAIESRGEPGKALDLGCGTGVFSVYLAKQGYVVTAIDLIPRALEMAGERARDEGVEITLGNVDILTWKTDEKFDVVLDSGCLHSLIGGDRYRYRSQLFSWLAPGGDDILGHFGKRHIFDWRPIGPKRRTRKQIVEFFAPELEELKYEQQLLTGIPFPIGRTVQGQGFWFRRKP